MKSTTKLTVCQIKRKYNQRRQNHAKRHRTTKKHQTKKEKQEMKRLKATITNLEARIKQTDKLSDLRAHFAQNQKLFSSSSMFSALCIYVNK